MIQPRDHGLPILAVACDLGGDHGQIASAAGTRFVTRAELRQHLVGLLTRIEADRQALSSKILELKAKPHPTLQ